MLYLNESDIRRSISYESMMDTMEDALRLFARGEYVMADRLAVPGGDTTMLYMPCFAGGFAQPADTDPDCYQESEKGTE